MITLRQLRYLSSLARHRHFGRAAEDCAISQPALSMQVKQLELEVGAELVERRASEVALTETGAEVAQRADRILAATRDLVDFARHRDVLTGQLKLGIIPTLAPYMLPRFLPGLQSKFPQLRLEVRETQTAVLMDELASGELDCLMLALPVEGADVETLKLFDDPFLLALPAHEVAAESGPIAVDDVDQRRLILLEEGHCLRDQALAFCATKRRDQPASLGATSLATVMQMVANGYGVTLLPQVAAEVEARDRRVKLRRFIAPEPGRAIGLAWRRTSPRKKDFDALGAVVKEAIGAGLAKALRRGESYTTSNT
jgi:LysR family transcriptional regulator, hydrogen peroxide-inducible genes activator